MRFAYLGPRFAGFLAACLALVSISLGGCGQTGKPGTAAEAAPTLAAAQQRGSEHFKRGDYAAAAEEWKQAVKLAIAESRKPAHADSLMNLGSAYQMLGQYDLAKLTLDEALDLAVQLNDTRRTVTALNDLAVACTLEPDTAIKPAGGHVHGGGNPNRDHNPESLLKRALELAEHEQPDARIGRARASIHDNLGNYYADTKHFDDAVSEYKKCMDLGEELKDPALIVKGAANAGASSLAAAKFYKSEAMRLLGSSRKKDREQSPDLINRALRCAKDAASEDEIAIARASSLPCSSLKAFVLNEVGQTDEQIVLLTFNMIDVFLGNVEKTQTIEPQDRKTFERAIKALPLSADDNQALEDRAERAYAQALKVSDECGDVLSRSYALGYLAHRAEVKQQYATAFELTRKAVFAAQKAESPDSLYRWQWQLGRLIQAQANKDVSDAAIASYQQAVDTVKSIRNDIALGNGNQRNRASFREDVGKMYFELADLQLLKSEKVGVNTPQGEQTLVDARATLESLKSAELEDYLRDGCVQLYKPKVQGRELKDTGVNGTAVIYIVALEDRTELLVQIRNHLYEFKTAHSRKELDATVGEFRGLVTDISKDEYKISGATLYEWLIRPLKGLLSDNKIDTLVFVPDGLLRTVPMAALFDKPANTHLIEEYAIAVVPGIELTEAGEPGERAQPGVLVSGLSEARDPFPALPFVKAELKNVEGEFHTGSSQELLNEGFLLTNLRSAIHNKRYTVIHIASHGQFGSEAGSTFILTYNPESPLTLDELEKLIRPQQYDPSGRPKPVDLLVLSCCQTAAGNDRAALGLAGVAVKSGARSAVATLWSVNDGSSPELIKQFYHQLFGTAGSIGQPQVSKARALQQAQIMMLHDENRVLRHPYLWAPYLIIGNWQ